MHDPDPQQHPHPALDPHPHLDSPAPHPTDAAVCAEELRVALAAHGIKLPSLGVDLITFGRAYPPHLAGLVALGNCNLGTARALTAVLREAAR